MSERLETPWERWSRDTRQVRALSSEELEEAFVLFLQRSASHDGLVPIDSVDYELPPALKPRGRKKEPVQIQHWLLTDTYHVVVEGRLVQLHPVDLEANARAPRARGVAEHDDPDRPPSRSAASLAFDRDLGAVTDPEGGFTDPTPEQESDQ